MHIPLTEFELHVKPDPLERGLSLFERGQVESIHSLGKGLVEAVVHDSDGTWHPQLKIEKEAVTGTACKCDTGGEGLCRHAVAVVFAMEVGQFKEGITTKSGKAPRQKAPGKGRTKIGDEPAAPKAVKAKPPKPPKPIKTAADIISRVPHDELVAFLLQECKLDKNIELRLKAHFSDLLPATTPAEILKRITETVKAAIGKSGKVNKAATGVLVKRLHEWALESGRLAEAASYDLAWVAASQVLLEFAALQNLSDTNFESAKDGLKIAARTLDQMGKADMPEATRKELLARVVAQQSGYDRSFEFLRLASRICTLGEEANQVEALFKAYSDDSVEVTETQLAMVRRLYGAEGVLAFAKKHANTRYFLLQEIETARKKGDLAKALKTIRRGFNLNQANPQRLGSWAHLELDLLAEMKDVQGQVDLALKLHQLGYQTPKISLRKIIEVAGRDQWIAERKKLLVDKDIRKWQHQESIMSLFEVDQDWESLSAYLSKYTASVIFSWSSNVGRRFPEAAWKVVTDTAIRIFQQSPKVSANALTDLLRELIALRGKVATKAFLQEMVQKFPKDLILPAVLSTFDKSTQYMYERSRYGF